MGRRDDQDAKLLRRLLERRQKERQGVLRLGDHQTTHERAEQLVHVVLVKVVIGSVGVLLVIGQALLLRACCARGRHGWAH